MDESGPTSSLVDEVSLWDLIIIIIIQEAILEEGG